GQLTMTNAEVAITIKAADDSKTYDGSALTNSTVTVTSGSLLTGDELVAEATGSVTNVSDTADGNNPIKTGYKIVHGTEDVTENYQITTAAGKLTITAKPVTVTAQSHAFTYNGEAQSWDKYDVDGLVGSDKISAVVTGSITFPRESPVTNVLTSYEFTTGTPGNYSVTTENGQLTMTNASAKITITAASKTWPYDGEAHSDTSVTVTSGTLFTGDSLVAEATGSVTNVSDTADGNNPIKAGYKIMHGTEDVTANYQITTEAGKLTITPVDITITMADRTLKYNGQDQYGWARSDAGQETVTGLVNNETVTITYTPSKGKTVNTYDNGAYDTATLVIKDGSKVVTGNYNLKSATPGKLTIEIDSTKELKVESASKDWDYDTAVHTYKVYTVMYGDEKITGTEGQTEFTLSTGDKLTVTPTEKGANGVKNVSDSGANSFTWTVENENCYKKGTDSVGTLTINPIDITIAMADRELPYNGETQYGWARTDDGKETVSGLVNNETVTITYTPSSGDIVDTYENGVYDETSLTIMDGSTDVTENYNLTSTTAGKLTITKVKVTIRIVGNHDTKPYNGTERSAEGYTVTIPADAKITKADLFRIIGKDEHDNPITVAVDKDNSCKVSRIDVGTSWMGLSAEKFGCIDAIKQNYDVTFEVENGYITVTPIGNIIVKVGGVSATKTYNAQQQNVTGITVDVENAPNAEIRQTIMNQVGLKDAYKDKDKAEGTHVGTYQMGLRKEYFKGAAYPGYTVVLDFVGDGSLTITPAEVTVTAQDASIEQGEDDPVFIATVTGVIAPDSVDLIQYTITREDGDKAGTYDITPSGAEYQGPDGHGDYKVIYVPAVLTITAPAAPIEIDEPEPPLTKAPPVWALLNLIAGIITVITGALMGISLIKKPNEDESEEAAAVRAAAGTEEEDKKRKKSKLLGIIPAAAAVITFLLTEDMSAQMVLVDKWTILMAIYLVAGGALAYFTRNKKDDKKEEEKTQG
ncbi:MAG: hypothetical protein IJH53_06665, partial [Oscillospiraceae bacterium]|nr:hypothetical protein [Oscillospiraceae bacterium]